MTQRLVPVGMLCTLSCIFGLAISGSVSASTQEDCHRALLESFDRIVDASTCDFLRMKDGRLAGIASERGFFFRSNDGDGTVYTWLNTRERSISITKNAQPAWTRPISGRQTFPDAKSFYFPFFLDAWNIRIVAEPTELRLFCPDPKNFTIATEAACD